MTNANAQHEKNFFFVDNKKSETDRSSLNGGEIKALAGVQSNYQLFLESHGNDPDKQVSDGETFVIGKPPLHFYAVPPATFGGK